MNKSILFFGVIVIMASLVLAGCYPTQSRYGYDEVGQIQVVKFGTVVQVRDIDITGGNSGAGGLGGAALGGTIGSRGASPSSAFSGAVVGGLVGGAIGSGIEQIVRNRGGVEYTVTLENGKTITTAQNNSSKDVFHNIGDRVMVQINGHYQRVLPANSLPTRIDRPKGIEFND